MEERNRLGFTQEGMASAGGVSKRAQGNYERGERSPDSDYWENLVKIGLDVQYVLTGVRSINLYRVAEEEPPKYRQEPTRKLVDPQVLAGVIAGVDEYLADHHKKMSPEKKTELIMLLCDFFTAETAQDKPVVKEAVGKIIQLKIRGT